MILPKIGEKEYEMNIYTMQKSVRDLNDNLQNLDRRLAKVYDLLEELARSTTISEADWNLVQDAITELEGV